MGGCAALSDGRASMQSCCWRSASSGVRHHRSNVEAPGVRKVAELRRREFEGEHRRRMAECEVATEGVRGRIPSQERQTPERGAPKSGVVSRDGRSTTGRSLLLEKCCGRQGHRGERLRMGSKSPRVRFELTSGLGCGGYLRSPAPFLELFQGAEPGKLRRRSDGAVVGRSAAESQGRRGTGSGGPQCCARLLGRGSPGTSPSDKEQQGGSDSVGQGAAELRERR